MRRLPLSFAVLELRVRCGRMTGWITRVGQQQETPVISPLDLYDFRWRIG